MDSVVSCAKMAEPIKMLIGRRSQVGSVNMYYMGCRCCDGKGHFWGV